MKKSPEFDYRMIAHKGNHGFSYTCVVMIMLLFFKTGCGDPAQNKRPTVVPEEKNLTLYHLHQLSEECKAFYEKYLVIMESDYDDEESFGLLGDFFTDSVSGESEYANYFRILLMTTDCSMGASIGFLTYEMFKDFPNKSDEMHKHIQCLPNRNVIRQAVFNSILLDLVEDCYCEEEFAKNFPWLSNEQNMLELQRGIERVMQEVPDYCRDHDEVAIPVVQ